MVLHRYQEASRLARTFDKGEAILAENILARFEAVEANLRSGFSNMLTSTIISSDSARPKPEITDGILTQKVLLPESVQQRALIWNLWIQNKIKAGEISELFLTHPDWHTLKIADGSLLPAGNLNIEVVEGIGRLRTRAHWNADIEEQLDLPVEDEIYGSGLDAWFVMTHVIEKDLLRLAATIDPSLIDGMKLTPGVYAKSYLPIVQLIDLNPQLDIRGVLSEGTWAYSRELSEVFPDQHTSQLSAIAGAVAELGPAANVGLPEQITFATYDKTRRRAYEDGRYNVGVAARFIDRQGMIAVLGQFGLHSII